jgi:hypothetical protein
MKVIVRIALEHLKHGGVENGLLPVTYRDFVKCGVRRNAVRQALLIAVHLGWVDKTSTGEVPWHGDIRSPSTFALTWLPQHSGAPASNRWTRIKSDADAKAAIRVAKVELAQARRLPPFFNRQRKPKPTPESVTWPGDDSDTHTSSDPVFGESKSPQISSNDCGTPFYISGYPATDANTATSKGPGVKGATAALSSQKPNVGPSRGAARIDHSVGDSSDDRGDG